MLLIKDNLLLSFIILVISISFSNTQEPTIQFSKDSGFYPEEFELTLSVSDNSKIYYTVDSSNPINSTTTKEYNGPIKINFDDLILLDNLVAEFCLSLALGQHHYVVDARLGLVDGGVVGMTRNLLVHYCKHRVGGLAQRQIDRLLRVVGYGLCLGLGACEHHIHNLFRLVGDNLRQQLVLRIDEP